MTTRVFNSDEDLRVLRPHWERLHTAARGSMFQTFQWNEIWRRIIGFRHQLRLHTQWEEDQIIGIAPYFLHSVRLGPLQVMRMSLLGEAVIPGEYAPLMLPGRERDCALAIANDWKESLLAGVADVIDLHSLPLHHTGIDALRAALADTGTRARYDRESIPRMTIALPSSWATYLNELSKKSRANYRRADRELRSGGMSYESIADPEGVQREFPRFVELHTRVWESRGRSGYFTSRKGFRAFLGEVVPALAGKGQARILLLRKGAEPRAGLLFFLVNGHACAYLSGRDPAVKASAGVWLLIQAAREAIEEGCDELDLVEGYAPYKERLGGQSSTFARLSVWSRGKRGLRGQLFVAALRGRSLLHSDRLPPFLTRIPLRIVEGLKGKAIQD